MIWLAWRLQRSIVIALVALAILIIGFTIVTGVIQHHYLVEFSHAPCFGEQRLVGASDRCGHLAVDMGNVSAYDPIIRAAGLIFGPLVGAIIGLFAVVNELDTRTARFAWTQSDSRLRWFSAKVGVGASLVAIILIPTVITLSWWDGAIAAGDRMGRFGFEIAGWDLVAYGLFAFALTVLAGSVIRRTGWTFAVVIVLYLGVAYTVPTQLRHDLAPVTVRHSAPSGISAPINSLQFLEGMVPRAYHGDLTQRESNATQLRFFTCVDFRPRQKQSVQIAREDRCYRTLDIWNVAVYIANDQFWTLQLHEGLLYLGAGLVLIGGAYVLVRRLEP